MQTEAFDIDLEALSSKPHILRRIFSGLRPFVTQALREEQIERDKTRQEVGSRLKALQDAASSGRGAELRKAAARTFAEVERIEPAYEVAVAKWKTARDELHRFNHQNGYLQQRTIDELRATADELIDGTIKTLRKMHADGFQQRYFEEVPIMKLRRDGQEEKIGVRSCRPSTIARQAAILAAINTADAWKADVDLTDIAERLRALVEGLPSPDTLVDEMLDGRSR